MAQGKFTIQKKNSDGYRIISVRMEERTLQKIEALSTAGNRSRNELINILLEHSVNDVEIHE